MNYQTVKIKSRNGARTASEKKKNLEAGELPVVLSRAGSAAMSLTVETAELQKAVHRSGMGGIMELVEDGGDKHLGMLKELQWHPVTRKLRHASFQEVKRNQVVNTTVPLIFVGEPAPVIDRSGQFIKSNEAVDVHAKVSSLPDHITLDISGMLVGDVLTAGGIPMPEGCEAVNPDTVICSVTTPTVIHLEVPTAETDVLGEAEAEAGETEETTEKTTTEE